MGRPSPRVYTARNADLGSDPWFGRSPSQVLSRRSLALARQLPVGRSGCSQMRFVIVLSVSELPGDCIRERESRMHVVLNKVYL